MSREGPISGISQRFVATPEGTFTEQRSPYFDGNPGMQSHVVCNALDVGSVRVNLGGENMPPKPDSAWFAIANG